MDKWKFTYTERAIIQDCELEGSNILAAIGDFYRIFGVAEIIKIELLK